MLLRWWKDDRAVVLRGRKKILNKVSVGAPAEGSLSLNTLASGKENFYNNLGAALAPWDVSLSAFVRKVLIWDF